MKLLPAEEFIETLLQFAVKTIFQALSRRSLRLSRCLACRWCTELILQESAKLVLEFVLNFANFASHLVVELIAILIQLWIHFLRNCVPDRSLRRVANQIR